MEVMTSKQVAELMSVKENTVRQWVQRGLLSPIAKPGRYEFAKSEVERFMAERAKGKDDDHHTANRTTN